MVRALAIAKLLMFLTISFLCITLTYQITKVGNHLSTTMMNVNDTLEQVNGKYGTVTEFNKVLVNAHELIIDVHKLTFKESQAIDAQNALLTHTVNNVNNLVTQLNITAISATANANEVTSRSNTLLQAGTSSVEALQRGIEQTNNNLIQLESVTNHLDVLVSDPELTKTIAHIQGTAAHLDATSKDVQDEVHSYTHPTWAMKIWEYTLEVAHALNPL